MADRQKKGDQKYIDAQRIEIKHMDVRHMPLVVQKYMSTHDYF